MKGFTFVELLVVLAIIAILTSFAVPSWRVGEGSLALDRAATKLSQDVRRSIELSLRAQWFSCATGRIAGYGLFFTTSTPKSYILFADCNNNQQYDAGTDGVVETITLEKQIQISSVTSGAFGLVVVPPEPAIFLKDRFGGSLTTAQIILQPVSNLSRTKTITINSKGVVTIQ